MTRHVLAFAVSFALATLPFAQFQAAPGTSLATPGQAQNRNFRGSNLVVDGDKVWIAVGYGGRGVRLRSLDIATGAKVDLISVATPTDNAGALVQRPGTPLMYVLAHDNSSFGAAPGRLLRFNTSTRAVTTLASFPEMTDATSLVLSSDGSVAIARWAGDGTFVTGIELSTGAKLWELEFVNSSNLTLSETPFGTLLSRTFKYFDGTNVRDLRLTDPFTGANVWNSSSTGATAAHTAMSGDATVAALTGSTFSQGGPPLDPTLLFDVATGNVLWSSPLGGDRVALNDDGSILLAGTDLVANNVRRHDGATGAVEWSVDLPQAGTPRFFDMAIDPTDSFAVIVGREIPTQNPYAIQRGLDLSDGSLLWSVDYPLGTSAFAYDIEFGPAGEVLIAMQSSGEPGSRSYVVAFDPATQTELWSYSEGVQ